MSSQSAVNKFKDWVSERVNHPLGVLLGVSAVKELEKENEILEPLVMEKQRAIQSLISENVVLREFANRMIDDISGRDSKEAKHYWRNELNQLLNKSESNHGN